MEVLLELRGAGDLLERAPVLPPAQLLELRPHRRNVEALHR